MRLTIIAGLMVGISLAIQSAHNAQARARVGQAASTVRVHVSAPWYTVINAGHNADTRSTLAQRLQEAGVATS
jgi:uncharacterized membrane protein YdcZ (DUF606 family)